MRTLPISNPSTRLAGRVEHIALTDRLAEITLNVSGSRLAVLARKAELPEGLARGANVAVDVLAGAVLLEGARAIYAVWLRDEAPASRPIAA